MPSRTRVLTSAEASEPGWSSRPEMMKNVASRPSPAQGWQSKRGIGRVRVVERDAHRWLPANDIQEVLELGLPDPVEVLVWLQGAAGGADAVEAQV